MANFDPAKFDWAAHNRRSTYLEARRASPTQLAAEQERQKDRLEARLQNQINRILGKVALEVAREVAQNGPGAATGVPAIAASEIRLESTLNTHYQRAERTFSRTLQAGLPRDLRLSQVERQALKDTLRSQWQFRAAAQATLLTQTTVNQINKAVAVQVPANVDPDTGIVNNRTLGQSLKVQLGRGAKARALGIGTTENQFASEQSKTAEAAALQGATILMKTWVSRGDSRVRDHHLAADGQRVPVGDPFIVGGESLMNPGDPAGSARNVINCRCTSVVSPEDVLNARQSDN